MDLNFPADRADHRGSRGIGFACAMAFAGELRRAPPHGRRNRWRRRGTNPRRKNVPVRDPLPPLFPPPPPPKGDTAASLVDAVVGHVTHLFLVNNAGAITARRHLSHTRGPKWREPGS